MYVQGHLYQAEPSPSSAAALKTDSRFPWSIRVSYVKMEFGSSQERRSRYNRVNYLESIENPYLCYTIHHITLHDLPTNRDRLNRAIISYFLRKN